MFSDGGNTLAVALANVNPIVHGPLALLNWTRIERGEPWAQYQQMTPRVAAVIDALDVERLAVAAAFGLQPRSLATHFAQSFGTQSRHLADIAAELHAARGGPLGPTTLATRFLTEDMPYALAFLQALARVAGVPVPAVQAVLATAALATGENHTKTNELLAPLRRSRNRWPDCSRGSTPSNRSSRSDVVAADLQGRRRWVPFSGGRPTRAWGVLPEEAGCSAHGACGRGLMRRKSAV